MNWATLTGLAMCLSVTLSFGSTLASASDARTDATPGKHEHVFARGDETPEVLPGTQRLQPSGDLLSQMLAGVDTYLTNALAAPVTAREAFWKRDFSSHGAYEQSIAGNRERFARLIGIVDTRESPAALQLIREGGAGPVIAEGRGYHVEALRWSVFDGVHGEGVVRLRGLSTGEGLSSVAGHRKWAWSAALNPDGRVLATGSSDGVVKLGDVDTGKEILTLQGHIALFSPDGGKLAYTVDKDIYVADLHAHDDDIERWLREAGVDPDPTSR